jgi:amyloid beta precursor protein binding protein 1
LVQDGARRDNPEGGEENFDEAVAAVLKTITPSTLPPSLREVFEYKRTNPVGQAHTLQADDPDRWRC